MRSDEEIDLMVRIRLVIILLRFRLITLGRVMPLLVLLGAAAVVSANFAQLMLLADLGHLPLDVVGARVDGARGKMGNNKSWLGMVITPQAILISYRPENRFLHFNRANHNFRLHFLSRQVV